MRRKGYFSNQVATDFLPAQNFVEISLTNVLSVNLTLAQAGASVVVAARREDKLKDLVSEIKKRGGQAYAVALDVTSAFSVSACFDAIEALGLLADGLLLPSPAAVGANIAVGSAPALIAADVMA